jgi:hypothetical protein
VRLPFGYVDRCGPAASLGIAFTSISLPFRNAGPPSRVKRRGASRSESSFPDGAGFARSASYLNPYSTGLALPRFCSPNHPAAGFGPRRSPASNFATTVAFCGMVRMRAKVLGRLEWKSFLHPRAAALSCPPPAIYGPGRGLVSRPVLCSEKGLPASGSGSSGSWLRGWLPLEMV